MIVRYEEVKLSRQAKDKNGKRKQKTFSMTLNPWNTNDKGEVRTRKEILECLEKQANEWEQSIK